MPDSRSPEAVLGAAILRVRAPDSTDGAAGDIGGAGFLITSELALTCAHVVCDALSLPRDAPRPDGVCLTVDLPLDGGGRGRASAEVEHWVPTGPDGRGDIAVLRLTAPIPGARPARMAEADTVWEHAARVAGFPAISPGGVWHRGRLLGGTAEGWVQFAAADGEAAPVQGGFSGSPVWDEQLGAVVGMVTRAQVTGERRQSFLIATRTIAQAVPELAEVLRPATPFRGLAAFQEEDAAVFFGRETEAQDIARLVRAHPYVTIVGPSGSGKTSLALAGVVPRLRTEGFEAVVVRPAAGRSLLTVLASELVALLHPELRGTEKLLRTRELEPLLSEPGRLAETIRLTLEESGAQRLLVVLDQSEELFAGGGEAAQAAAGVLFPSDPSEELRVLVTLRADFLEAALSHPATGPALSRTVHALAPMNREQLRAVITRPVETVAGVEYDPGLVTAMLDDAGAEPGALPLLGFVLERLWRGQRHGVLRFDTYQELGGVQGALGRQAETIWHACVADQDTDTALRLLTGLVRVLPGGEGTLRNVLTREEAGPQRWRIAQALARQRLLVLGSSPEAGETVELAHEALIRAWPRLAQRVEDDRAFLTWRAGLRRDMERWEASERRTERLPGVDELRAARPWLDSRSAELTAGERDFLQRGQQHRQKVTRAKRAAWAAGALVMVLLVTLSTSLVVTSGAKEQREAEAHSRELADISADLAERDPVLAARVAMAAYKAAPTREAGNELLRRYMGYRDTQWAVSGTQGALDAMATSADGAVTLITTELGRGTLFVRGAGGRVRRVQFPVERYLSYPMVSADGRRIAYTTEKGSLVWHEVWPDSKALLGRGRTLHGGGTAHDDDKRIDFTQRRVAVLSQDGTRAATISGRQIDLWDLEAGKHWTLPVSAPAALSVSFGPDNDTLVVDEAAKTPNLAQMGPVVAMDARTGKTRKLGATITSTAVSGGGSTAVMCKQGGGDLDGQVVYRAVRVKDGREISRYSDGKLISCNDMAVDSAGHRMALEDESRRVLVDVPSGKQLATTDGFTESGDGELTNPQLLGGPEKPVLVTARGTQVTARPLATRPQPELALPTLLDHGRRLIGREGTAEHQRIRLVDPLRQMRSLAASRPLSKKDLGGHPVWAEELEDLPLAVGRNEKLMADVVAYNKVVVRSLPSLREVSQITLPLGRANHFGDREAPSAHFLSSGALLTQVEGRLDRWDPETGRRLSTVDLRDLKLSKRGPKPFDPQEDPPVSGFWVGSYPKKDHVLVKVEGDAKVHVVDLREQREAKELGFRVGADSVTVHMDRSGKYAAVYARGAMVELWSMRADGEARRSLGPIGPITQSGEGRGFVASFLSGQRFLLAEGDSARIYKAGGRSYDISYDFGEPQTFLNASQDGKVLLSKTPDDFDIVPSGGFDVVRLDPALWRDKLCRVVGQQRFTAPERSAVPAELPDRVCPD
ncbi:serine protease [Streptomyces iranensis]|uniref:S1-C subfamily serine protease n=1 Tax=Streptomyces iranensis TaxID=576784 RepID=A0ABS4MIL2_9ACTN|nr:serine protease [Streptomyces iranensis]MBP2059540.1 S1-C subfamily serine protease [Streptomyces iranensis]